MTAKKPYEPGCHYWVLHGGEWEVALFDLSERVDSEPEGVWLITGEDDSFPVDYFETVEGPLKPPPYGDDRDLDDDSVGEDE